MKRRDFIKTVGACLLGSSCQASPKAKKVLIRLSCEVDDSGYFNSSRYESIEIFLDGRSIPPCITADEELGYVKCNLLDSDGKLVLTEDAQGKPCKTIEEKYGKVRIKLVLDKDAKGDTSSITHEKCGKVRIEAPIKLTRISSFSDDPGYPFFLTHDGDVKIFLDDVLVKYPLTADVRLGYVRYYLCDGDIG